MAQVTDNSMGKWRLSGPSALLAALVLLMLSAPLLGPRIGLGMVMEGAFTLVVLASAYALYRQGRLFWVLLALSVPSLAIGWLDRLGVIGSPWDDIGDAILAILLVVVVVAMIRALFVADRGTLGAIIQAISAYLLLGITFAVVYTIACRVDPAALQRGQHPLGGYAEGVKFTDTLYFSFVALTTVGFGDITPAVPLMQTLATMEAAIGPIYLAVVLARLVALFLQQQKAPPP